MKNFKKINKLLRILQIAAAVVMTAMMVKAMKTLYVLMKTEGLF